MEKSVFLSILALVLESLNLEMNCMVLEDRLDSGVDYSEQ